MRRAFQSPYGGIGASDAVLNDMERSFEAVSITLRWQGLVRLYRRYCFQIVDSDSFNHLAVAGVGQTIL